MEMIVELLCHLFEHVVLEVGRELGLRPLVTVTGLQAFELDGHQVALVAESARVPVVLLFVAVLLAAVLEHHGHIVVGEDLVLDAVSENKTKIVD